MDETRRIEVRRLFEVERLTMRQIAEKLRMGRKTVSRILAEEPTKRPSKPLIIAPYERLIAEWYKATPALLASQVFQRLRGYGYPGGQASDEGVSPKAARGVLPDRLQKVRGPEHHRHDQPHPLPVG